MTAAARPFAKARDSFRQLGRTSDYLVSFGTEAVTLALGLLVFKLAAYYWGPVGFGEYVLSRRAISLLALPLSCGMAVGITRYVAAGDPEDTRSHAMAALAIVAISTVAGLGIMNSLPGPAASLFFGEARYAHLLVPISAAVAGMVLHGVAYGLLRGRMRIIHANALQFLNLAALPLLVFGIGGLSVGGLLVRLGVLWSATSLGGIALGLRGVPRSTSHVGESARHLVQYGVPRVPGELALAALFALPPIAVAHLGSIEAAGHVGFATSLLTMIGSSFAPLGVVVLPAVSAAIANKRADNLWHDSLRIVGVCAGLAALLVLLLEVGAGVIVRYGLGPEFAAAAAPLRIVVLGGIPYVVYVVLRNVLDAASVKPLNARNLLAALAVFGAVAAALRRADLIPWVLLASVATLGLLTLRDARRVLRDGYGRG